MAEEKDIPVILDMCYQLSVYEELEFRAYKFTTYKEVYTRGFDRGARQRVALMLRVLPFSFSPLLFLFLTLLLTPPGLPRWHSLIRGQPV